MIADEYLKELRLSGKQNQLSANEPWANLFREFLHREDIAFRDITVSLLRNFKATCARSGR